MQVVSSFWIGLIAGTIAAGALASQCPRPTPPAAGLSYDLQPAIPVVYSDGYQTFSSLLMPTAPAPSCGWPLVVYVHPLGGSRGDESSLQIAIAQQGYAVWAYDVRGQGQADALNLTHPMRGSALWGPVERYDLAEQVAFVANEPQWAGVIDTTRLGVLGTSQGGGHAWAAAALSGQPLSLPTRSPIVFPTVACAIARDLVGNTAQDWVREEALFSTWFLEAASASYAALPFDPAFVQAARDAFIQQDPASLSAAWLADGRDIEALLASSSVPLLYDHAYFDNVSAPGLGVRNAATMMGPTRVLLGTLGHGTPDNLLERDASDNLQLRWLHRWLWDQHNEVDAEVPNVLSQLPLEGALRDDPSHAWSRSTATTLVPTLGAERLYLHEDYSLQSIQPSPPASDPIIDHIVDPAAAQFTPANYFDDPSVRATSSVLAAAPLDELVWSYTIPQEFELVGTCRLELELAADHPSWMVAALLTVEAPGGGSETMLTHGATGSRTSVPAIAELREILLAPTAATLPAGSIVRLRLRNLYLREAPMAQTLACAPLFDDYQVAVKLGHQSVLELPLQQRTPDLVVSRQSMLLATADPVQATIRGGAQHADDPYFVVVGLSGSAPATPYLNSFVPAEDDWLFVASAGSTLPYYSGFLGFLDANGDASCTLDYSFAAPLPQLLNGLQLTMAAFIWDYEWSPTGEPTNPCDILLR
ncbi:MAG: alpha/beta fold hydrolase [Planctomycetota bacterium]